MICALGQIAWRGHAADESLVSPREDPTQETSRAMSGLSVEEFHFDLRTRFDSSFSSSRRFALVNSQEVGASMLERLSDGPAADCGIVGSFERTSPKDDSNLMNRSRGGRRQQLERSFLYEKPLVLKAYEFVNLAPRLARLGISFASMNLYLME